MASNDEESNEDNHRRDSFSDRICDDLAKVILQYMSVEERNRLECVSKQFQRTVFEGKFRLDIDFYNLERKGFLQRYQHILKDFKNIESIRIDDDYGEVQTESRKIAKTLLFDTINDFCKNQTKFILEIECIPEEVMQRFFEKFGSNIIKLRIREPIHEVFASIRESNVEKIVVEHYIDSLNRILFNRLKYFELEIEDTTRDLDQLEVFIKRNKHNIKHFDLILWTETDEAKIRVLNIISDLSNLVELKPRIDLDFNDKPIAKHLTQIANKCQKLKNIGIYFIMISKNCEDINDVLTLLRQFKRLRRLEVSFYNSDDSKESIELFSFKVFKGLENITHLSIEFFRISEPLSETILTDIDINFPKLQDFTFDNDLDVTDWTVDILSRLSNLQKVDFKISENADQFESKLIEKCRKNTNN